MPEKRRFKIAYSSDNSHRKNSMINAQKFFLASAGDNWFKYKIKIQEIGPRQSSDKPTLNGSPISLKPQQERSFAETLGNLRKTSTILIRYWHYFQNLSASHQTPHPLKLQTF